MIYEVISDRGSELQRVYENLSYDGVVSRLIDHLMSDDVGSITVARRCCSSMSHKTMDEETANSIRDLVKNENDPKIKRRKLDVAVNNWYLRGKISLSDEDAVRLQNIVCGEDEQ